MGGTFRSMCRKLRIQCVWQRLILAAVLLALLSVPSLRAVRAQEQNAESPPQLPFLVVNFAGVERILSDADYTFAITGRPELSDVLVGLMANVGDLQGMDRDRPLGFMFYLQPGIPPQPVAVTYIPVKDVTALVRTVSQGPFTARKVAEGDYEITTPGATLHAKLQGEYAFVSEDATLLEQEFPDPVTLTQTLTARYDLAAMLNVKNIPEGMRVILTEALKAAIEADLQQRDDEPDAAYQLRKANGMSGLQFLEQLLTQGQDVTFGLDVSPENKGAVFEMSINAQADSKFAKYLHDVGRRPSSFASLLQTQAPLTASLSWTLADREKKVLLQLVKSAQITIAEQFAKSETDAAVFEDFFAPLTATAEAGHFDGFLQFLPRAGGEFVMIGGVKVLQGEQLAVGLSALLKKLQDQPDGLSVELGFDSHQGVTFHRVARKDRSEGPPGVLGENPKTYLGAAPRAVWFAVGSEAALTELKTAIDTVATAEGVLPEGRDAPFELYFNMRPWIDRNPTDENENPNRQLQQARDAFEPGSDALHVHLRPTERGVRLRAEMGEGFVRYIGLGAARRLDWITEQQMKKEQQKAK